jgi:parallel beta-helix repeat protein
MLARYHTRVGGAQWAPLRRVIFLLLALLPIITARAAPNLSSARVVSASPENTLAVTTTADVVDGNTSSFSALNGEPGPDGAISLREALLSANATPTATLDLTITFSIPITDSGHDQASDTWTIFVGSGTGPEFATNLPPLTRGRIHIDGSTQPSAGNSLSIVLDGGNDFEVPTNGLTITSGNNVVRGLTIVNFFDNGISISGSTAAYNQVAGCYLGPNADGLSAPPKETNNGVGVLLADGAHHNTIGGSASSDSNLISGNGADAGVLIKDAATTNNTILGNWIGVDVTGRAALPNALAGVLIAGGAHGNTIGGVTAGARNLISGNSFGGVVLQAAATANNMVAGNWIGVDATGQVALPNAEAGVWIDDAQHNQIGGAGQGNLISGNDAGINIYGGDANTIAGNTIGLAANGAALGNHDVGIYIQAGASDNVVGGASAAVRNIISANGIGSTPYGQGIYIEGTGTTTNTIQGNYIGVGASGNAAGFGNRREGILIGYGAEANIVGGSAPSAGNVIAYNGGGGITLRSAWNKVIGNLIGWGADRSTILGNQSNGIWIWNPNNQIGPGNQIGNSHLSGIQLIAPDTGTFSNTLIFSNTLKSNQRSGICVVRASAIITGNELFDNGGQPGTDPNCGIQGIQGGIVLTGTLATSVLSNIIQDNTGAGVTVRSGAENSLLGNSISGNTKGGIVLQFGGNGNIAAPKSVSAIRDAGRLEVSGASCAFCHVEIFNDDGDQGRVFIRAVTAQADGSFSTTLPASLLSLPFVTATNTDSNGNTSPFAIPAHISSVRPPPVYLPIIHMPKRP